MDCPVDLELVAIVIQKNRLFLLATGYDLSVRSVKVHRRRPASCCRTITHLIIILHYETSGLTESCATTSESQITATVTKTPVTAVRFAPTAAQDASERVAELPRQAVVQYGIDRAVHVEENAHSDLNVPVVAKRQRHELAGEREYDPPDFDGKHAAVENNDHPHEHEDELLARLDVPLQVSVHAEQRLDLLLCAEAGASTI
jgi:hypothetical protein